MLSSQAKETTKRIQRTMETKTMNTRQAEIEAFEQATGYRLTERADGWLYYDGDIDLAGFERNISLPSYTIIDGNICLLGSEITTLPKCFKVRGILDASYSSLEVIAEGVEVEDSLHIAGTHVRVLPEGLKLFTLEISHTWITHLPEDIEVEELIWEKNEEDIEE